MICASNNFVKFHDDSIQRKALQRLCLDLTQAISVCAFKHISITISNNETFEKNVKKSLVKVL